MKSFKEISRWIRRLTQFSSHGFSPKVDKSVASRYFGSVYGGWDVAVDLLDTSSIVYSAGLGCDISFDLSLIKKYSLRIFGFDPTPKSLSWLKAQKLPPEFQYFPVGLSNSDGTLQFSTPDNPEHVSYKKSSGAKIADTVSFPVKRLQTLMDELGHDHLDILKMDIEGSEYDVIPDLIESKIFPKQLLVEFHHRINNTGIRNTKEQVSMLESVGYRIFSISDLGDEFSMILL